VETLLEGERPEFHWVSHHLAHAASAYYPSGFPDAAILVVDGIGECGTAMLAHGVGEAIRPVRELMYPHSLGFLWEKLSELLGFSEYDACKVMGLAAYGDPEALWPRFQRIATFDADGLPVVDPAVLQFRLPRFDGLEHALGLPRRAPTAPLRSEHRDLAAALQRYTEDAVLSMGALAHATLGCKSLCYAGGVALNCVANSRLKEEGPFEQLFIPSAPNDAGTAIGAALQLYHARAPRGAYVESAYSGPELSDGDVERALAGTAFEVRRVEDPAAEAARLLARGEVVGWLQGRMEFGPRALGNRSLLADPRHAETREVLNRVVKHREDFRPFGPSVLADKAEDWFELGARRSPSMSYMLFTCPVRAERRARIPAVTHVDGSARLQLVTADGNPMYHRLITEFDRLTDTPVVLNTSFNDSEPIVCTPSDALSTFARTRFGALVMGNFVVQRSV
jgi:carbamoyltransferase